MLATNDAYGQAGGGLLASGLAFSALFAVIPGLLLVVSLLIVIVDDQAGRQRAIDWLVAQVPPLRDVATTVVTNLASDAKVGSLLGVALFAWGASSFYLGLKGAIDRAIPGGKPENPVLARVQAILGVALLLFAALVGFVVAGIASVVSLGSWAAVLSPIAAIAVATGLALAVYLLLPNDRPTVRQAAPAAVAAGVGIGLLTAFFGALAPFLVQGFVALGVIASVFIALVWFGWTFQILLFGACYVRLRRDRERAASQSNPPACRLRVDVDGPGPPGPSGQCHGGLWPRSSTKTQPSSAGTRRHPGVSGPAPRSRQRPPNGGRSCAPGRPVPDGRTGIAGCSAMPPLHLRPALTWRCSGQAAIVSSSDGVCINPIRMGFSGPRAAAVIRRSGPVHGPARRRSRWAHRPCHSGG